MSTPKKYSLLVTSLGLIVRTVDGRYALELTAPELGGMSYAEQLVTGYTIADVEAVADDAEREAILAFAADEGVSFS